MGQALSADPGGAVQLVHDQCPTPAPWSARWPGATPAGPRSRSRVRPGTATAELSARFGFVVGLDYVFPAVAQAQRRLESDGRAASFVVADASTPPFRPGSFSFVFDRGCLQNIPRDRWLTYFEQTERILAPRGVLQLLCSRTTGRASVFSRAGLKTRLHSMLGKPAGPPGPQPGPATLQVDLMEDFPFVTQRGTSAPSRTGSSASRPPTVADESLTDRPPRPGRPLVIVLVLALAVAAAATVAVLAHDSGTGDRGSAAT